VIIEDFRKIVADLKHGPIPGKHAYVWTGDKSALLEMTGKTLGKELDLSSDLDINARDVERNGQNAGRFIQKALEKKLFDLYSDVNRQGVQQILLVSSSSLIARYRIGLTAFYNYYLGDHTKAVFVVPKPQTFINLPEYVKYDPEEPVKYLGNLVQAENIVE
jgi:hypothetical protein